MSFSWFHIHSICSYYADISWCGPVLCGCVCQPCDWGPDGNGRLLHHQILCACSWLAILSFITAYPSCTVSFPLPVLEPMIVLVMGYLSYILADMFEFSGIVRWERNFLHLFVLLFSYYLLIWPLPLSQLVWPHDLVVCCYLQFDLMNLLVVVCSLILKCCCLCGLLMFTVWFPVALSWDTILKSISPESQSRPQNMSWKFSGKSRILPSSYPSMFLTFGHT